VNVDGSCNCRVGSVDLMGHPCTVKSLSTVLKLVTLEQQSHVDFIIHICIILYILTCTDRLFTLCYVSGVQ